MTKQIKHIRHHRKGPKKGQPFFAGSKIKPTCDKCGWKGYWNIGWAKDKNWRKSALPKQFPETKYPVFSDSWFRECFKGVRASPEIKKAAVEIVRRYKIGGLSDPGYIANVIKNSPTPEDAAIKLSHAYSTMNVREVDVLRMIENISNFTKIPLPINRTIRCRR